MRFSALFSSFAAIFVTACGGQPQNTCADPSRVGSSISGPSIVVSQPWVRAATPGHPMSAAYLQLCNSADSPDRLVGATFEGARAAELHITKISEDNVAAMSAMSSGIALPPGSVVDLKPDNAHIMLIDLTGPLVEGDDAAITLMFENAPPVSILFEIRGLGDISTHSGH